MKKRTLILLLVCFASIGNIFGQELDYLEDLGTWSAPFSTSKSLWPSTDSPRDIEYRFTLTTPMDITVSNSRSTLKGSSIILYNSDFESVGRVHSPGESSYEVTASSLPAGTYVISISWYDTKGAIYIDLKGETPNITRIARNIGAFTSPFEYTDTQDTSDPSIAYQGPGTYNSGVCYRFTISHNMNVTISHCGSSLNKTDLYLLDEQGRNISTNSENTPLHDCENPEQAYLEMNDLTAGTYHVVSVGGYHDYGYLKGNITTRITGTSIEENAGSSDRNYIMTRIYKDDLGSNWMDKIDYFDAMGRAEQSVSVGASPEGGDIVSASEYDAYGRICKTWLPAEVKNNAGNYTSMTVLPSKVKSAYNEDPSPFSRVNYEPSPIDRPVAQYGPGDDWLSKDKAVRTDYQLTNIAGDNSLNCIRYQVSDKAENNDTLITITNMGNYPTGSLQGLRKKDEDGNTLIEFYNHAGQVVLSRQIPKSDTRHYDTYSIYDEWGNLRTVLPPLAADGMKSAKGSWSNQDRVICNYVYLYKYDDRFRMTAKRLPGQDWTRYVYDKADTPVFTQDGEQRKRREWAFAITDGLKRVCLTGICKNNFSSASLDAKVNAVRNNTSGNYKGYAVTGVTLTAPQVMTVNYYDDYKFMGKNGVPSENDSNYKYDVVSDYDKRYSGSAQSLLTGTLTAKLNNQIPISYLPSVMYYDYRGRLIQSKTGTHLTGGIGKEYIAYDFMGNQLKHKHIHTATGESTLTEEYTYTYDHAGRLLTSKHSLNGKPAVTLTDNEYDCTGRLKVNKRNGNAELKTSYSYNVRSWTKSISSPLFSQTLYYNDKRKNESNEARYNGNISGMDWTTSSDNIRRGYDFAYDGLSQLTNARYLENDIRSDKFNTSYSYDKQGNVLTLSRRGLTASGKYGLLDDLRLTLNGNQLKTVNDVATDSAYNNGFEFKDGDSAAIEYFYDANGNLIKDLNKKITEIQYNYLNLPNRIVFEDGNFVSYLYDAAGTKLNATHSIVGDVTTTDYCGNVIFENGNSKTLLTEAGYVSLIDGKYHFYLQDHLGNNRMVADQNGKVEEVNHYYPFGGTFAATSSVQPYKYNGKELDRSNGLNWYDYGARHYDAAIGRWHAVDPMGEIYYNQSPYDYCENNPVRLTDMDGMLADDPIKPTIHLPEVTIIGQKVMNPVSGFWGSVNYYLFGRTYSSPVYGIDNGIQTAKPISYITYDVNKEGFVTRVTPMGGIAPLPSTTSLNIKDIAKLLQAGKAAGKGGLTAVGRGLKKHGDRVGSAFPKAIGNQAAINQQGEKVLKSILENPNVQKNINNGSFNAGRYGIGSIDYQIPGGIGARFNSDGTKFIGFLEPK